MDIKRRQFLKIAGISTIAGIAAPAGLQMLLKGECPSSSLASSASSSAGASHAPARTGKRYGMVINQRLLVANKGLADKCIEACHTVHNVPDFGNPKDEIKWIWKTPFESAFTAKSHNLTNDFLHADDFLVLCNHCDNPPCVRVCPTKATFQNKDGLVLMDYHRCIGCRFCMAACPFGARSFNWRDPRPFIDQSNYNKEFPTRMRGVVEKCNFCAERLAKNLQPACVEAAKGSKALVFGDLNDEHSEIRKVLKHNYTIQRKPELGTSPSVFYII